MGEEPRIVVTTLVRPASAFLLGLTLFGSGPGAAAEPTDWATLLLSTSAVDRRLAEQIPKLEWWNACAEWGREERKPGARSRRGEALLWYLEAERMLNSLDRGHVAQRTVDIGMTECGVFASKGAPEHANQTITAHGRSVQFVYGRMYIYTEPSPKYPIGIVRAIQK